MNLFQKKKVIHMVEDVILLGTKKTCSARVGITQLSASPLTLETPSETKITVTFKRPEGTGSVQDFIGLFPKQQTDSRHPIDFAVPAQDYGFVTFSVPHYAGVYQVGIEL